MPKKFALITFISLSLLHPKGAIAQQSQERIGFIAESAGRLWVERDGKWSKTRQPDRIFKDDSVETGRRGTATMEDGPRWQWGIDPKTRTHMHWSPEGSLTLYRSGALYGNSNKGQTRNVLTESGTLKTRGTSFYVEVDEQGTTRVLVFDGSVELRGRAGGTLTVTAGRAAEVSIGGRPRSLSNVPPVLIRNAYRLSTATVALTSPTDASPDTRFSTLISRRAAAQQTTRNLAAPVDGPSGQGKGE